MINLIRAGIVMLVLAGCGSETPTRPNDFTPLTSIKIVATVTPSIAPQTSIKLSAMGDYSGLFTRDISDQVVWASNAPAVADFVIPGSPGRVTGKAQGAAGLTATKGGVTASFQLAVSNATLTTMAISPLAPTVHKGLSTQFSASGTFSDSTIQDLTHDVTWTSDTQTIATISDVAGSKGLAKALLEGTTTISAKFLEQAPVTTLLTVTIPQLQSITVNPVTPASSSLLSLSTATLKATGHYSDGTTPDITSLVIWNSSRPDIATVAAGTVRTLLEGTTVISASLGVTGTTSLKVTGGNLTGITVSPANPRLVRGTTGRVTATGTFSNGTTRDITALVGWVPDPAFATVTVPVGNLAWLAAGAVTGLTPTKVKATVGSHTGEADLTVVAPALSSILIQSTRTDLSVGTSDRFTLTGTFNDGTTQDLTFDSTWTSGNPAVAAVSNDGITKGLVTGIATNLTAVTINASYGGLTAQKPITIMARTLDSLNLSGSASITPGKQEKYIAKAHYSDGTILDVTEKAVWTIDNPNIANFADALNQPGQVVAIDSGIATLTAVFGGKTQTFKITVP